MKRKRNKIGFTYGDPASIGPEILYKALKKNKCKSLIPIIYGDKEIIENLRKYHNIKPSRISGAHAYKYLKEAVKSAMNSEIKALITGPVSKSLVNLSVPGFRGQTEELAKLCNVDTEKVIMLFSSKDFRVSLYSRHIPIKNVSNSLSSAQLKNHILLLRKELKKWFKIDDPTIAVLGLNPHAGESGLMGDEEKKIIIPVLNKLKKQGVKIYGPLSPDATLADAGQRYIKGKKQSYDVIVSMYHDQALPLFKGITGREGLNITLGLPFLRISPDHGTAFDIVGKGCADCSGILSAIELIHDLS